jgi:hypothetical protein
MKVKKAIVDKAAKEYAKGDEALAAAFKAGFEACRSLANYQLARMPDEFDRRKKLTKAEIKEALRLRAEGWTYKAIAGKFGVSIYCVQYHCHCDEMREYAKAYYAKRYPEMTDAEREEHRKQVAASMEYKKSLRIRGIL